MSASSLWVAIQFTLTSPYVPGPHSYAMKVTGALLGKKVLAVAAGREHALVSTFDHYTVCPRLKPCTPLLLSIGERRLVGQESAGCGGGARACAGVHL